MLMARGPGDGKVTGPDSGVQCRAVHAAHRGTARRRAGSCTDDRHDDGRRGHFEVDSVVFEEPCASFVEVPPNPFAHLFGNEP